MTLQIATLLWAIAQVESGGNDRLVGPCGERSRYQISETVWRQHTREPFSRCRGKRATAVAEKHVRWLQRELDEVGISPYCVAHAWHAGLSARKPTPKTHSYAQRVSDLYWERLDQTTTRKGP